MGASALPAANSLQIAHQFDNFFTKEEADALIQHGYEEEYKRSEDVGEENFVQLKHLLMVFCISALPTFVLSGLKEIFAIKWI